MRGNYIAVFIHAVWATKYRLPILPKNIRYPLFEHIRKHALDKGIDLRIVNGVEDHVHCLFRLLSTQKYAWVIQMLKGESSKWLNEAFFLKEEGQKILAEVVKKQMGLNPKYDRYLPGVCDFKWQDGYGALSVSPQNVGTGDPVYFQPRRTPQKTITGGGIEAVSVLCR